MTSSRGPLLEWDEYRAAAQWLPQARAGADMTQAQLGDLLGRSNGWIALRETGSVRMTRDEVERLAGALGVAVPTLSAARRGQ